MDAGTEEIAARNAATSIANLDEQTIKLRRRALRLVEELRQRSKVAALDCNGDLMRKHDGDAGVIEGLVKAIDAAALRSAPDGWTAGAEAMREAASRSCFSCADTFRKMGIEDIARAFESQGNMVAIMPIPPAKAPRKEGGGDE